MIDQKDVLIQIIDIRLEVVFPIAPLSLVYGFNSEELQGEAITAVNAQRQLIRDESKQRHIA